MVGVFGCECESWWCEADGSWDHAMGSTGKTKVGTAGRGRVDVECTFRFGRAVSRPVSRNVAIEEGVILRMRAVAAGYD